jgi:hypothetical protein
LHLKKAYNFDHYNIILVQQDFNNNFEKIINFFKFKKFFLFKTKYPKTWNVYKKMLLNGRKGMKFAFENLKTDFCLYLEDDIIVSKDFFLYNEFILNKFRDDNYFFAVNAFSKERFQIQNINNYSKFRYGIGKGWGINKNRWLIIKKLWSNNSFINGLSPCYDAPIENYIKKKGFYVVMPSCSRTFEFPSSGVSINEKNNAKYYNALKKSFNNSALKPKYNYSIFMTYKWRNDCYKYYGKIITFFFLFLEKWYFKIKNYV